MSNKKIILEELNKLKTFQYRLENTLEYTKEQIKELTKKLKNLCSHQKIVQINYRHNDGKEVIYECQECSTNVNSNEINLNNIIQVENY